MIELSPEKVNSFFNNIQIITVKQLITKIFSECVPFLYRTAKCAVPPHALRRNTGNPVGVMLRRLSCRTNAASASGIRTARNGKTQIQDKHHEKSYCATRNEKTHDAQTVQSLSAHRGMLADTKKPRKEAGLRL
jgi:hypothetical protein